MLKLIRRSSARYFSLSPICSRFTSSSLMRYGATTTVFPDVNNSLQQSLEYFGKSGQKKVEFLQSSIGIIHKRHAESYSTYIKKRVDEDLLKDLDSDVKLCAEGNMSVGKTTFLERATNETLELKNVVEVVPEPINKRRLTGIVKFYNHKYCWGIITIDHGLGDIRVDKKDIRHCCPLNSGDLVEFDIASDGNNRFIAVDVSAPGGAPLEPRKRGFVRSFSIETGYGFIQPKAGGNDILFYECNVIGTRYPFIGEEVEFLLIESDKYKGNRAVDVTKLENKPFSEEE